jgi:fructose-1-phosphate kinase PfkB-like protein
MEAHDLAEARQEARRILLDIARSIDRRLDVEVREIPGQERIHVTLTHGQHKSHTEMPFPPSSVPPRTPSPSTSSSSS